MPTTPLPPPTPASRLTPSVIAALAVTCLVLVLLSIAFLDRPLASYAHDTWRTNRAFDAFTHLVDPIPIIAAFMTGGFVVAILFGAKLPPRIVIAARIAVAILIAIALKEQIKIFSGRTWPETWTGNNPSYIKDGVFGFQLFRGFEGGRAFHAFPSGHMTTISVACTALALAVPRYRSLAPIPVALVAIGLIGANYHWLSDIIAGTFLGAAIALAAHRVGPNAA